MASAWRKWSLITGLGAAAIAAAAGLAWAHPWHETQTVHPSAQLSVPGPFLDAPSPPDESRLLYSTRTWKSYRERTSGFVEIFQLADGSRILRLADLVVPHVPGEAVWLSRQAYTGADVRGGAVMLGPLYGARRSISYPIPSGLDLGSYASVAIVDPHTPTPVSAAPLR
jgi:hypothetical protein